MEVSGQPHVPAAILLE